MILLDVTHDESDSSGSENEPQEVVVLEKRISLLKGNFTEQEMQAWATSRGHETQIDANVSMIELNDGMWDGVCRFIPPGGTAAMIDQMAYLTYGQAINLVCDGEHEHADAMMEAFRTLSGS